MTSAHGSAPPLPPGANVKPLPELTGIWYPVIDVPRVWSVHTPGPVRVVAACLHAAMTSSGAWVMFPDVTVAVPVELFAVADWSSVGFAPSPAASRAQIPVFPEDSPLVTVTANDADPP